MISLEYGVHFDWAPFFCAEIKGGFVFVTNNNRKLRNFASVFAKINDIDYVILPEFENEIYEKLPYNRQIACERSAALYKIFNKKSNIILTTAKALCYKTASVEHFDNIIELNINDKISIELLKTKLNMYSYDFVSITELPGQFSVRGGIIDVFPVTSSIPYRIEFFDNCIERIKTFSTETPRSILNVQTIVISRCLELPDIKEYAYKFKDPHTQELVEHGILFSGIEWKMNMFYDKTISILDYLPDNYIFDFELEKYNFDKNEEVYCDNITLLKEKCNIREICPILSENAFARKNDFCTSIRDKDFLDIFNEKVKDFKKIIISVKSSGMLDVVTDILPKNYNICSNFMSCKDGVNILISSLESGFIRNDTIIFTEKELKLRTESVKPPQKRNRRIFAPGTYVVHKQHGIGIFDGIVNLEINDISYDFLSVLYKNNDKLLVPVEQIKLLSYYGDSDSDVQVDKLGGEGWGSRYEKVRKKLLVIADELIEKAAKRKMKKIAPINIDFNSYEKFCKNFRYEETRDQMAAIRDVERDLTATCPMDRLICGDVGFGKTEVAMRAAFIVANSGKQVVVLAPTTILVNQHYKNFKTRFNNDIKVIEISRFVSKIQLKEYLQYIESGLPCVIIATHAILKKDIPNLGLIIIDEEQHFGVKQKEILKKENIHVLSMSATPIPRTLQMSLSGIMDFSMITTPPVDRLVVKTFVINEDDQEIDIAINREINRGGQIFVVSPRIEFLDKIEQRMRKHFPKIRIKVAHGKMDDIEDTINQFCNGELDILISTNIIDSGIDIKNANTIIIYRADMFGTSQLYQLRGRVGRLHGVQGYAYMLLPNEDLSSSAETRLNAIQSACMFGGGFKLANLDLEIRGSGNIIGNEQSGHIRDVGIEMYQNMLEKAINMQNIEEITPKVNLGIPVFIPHYYIPDEDLRINLYREIGDVDDILELDNIKADIIDRFGTIPNEFNNLLIVMRIKLMCIKANIEQIDVGAKGYVISFFQNNVKCAEKLIQLVTNTNNEIKIKPDNKLVICKTWRNVNDRTRDIEDMIKNLM